jgi:hypothetical protein
MRLRRRHLLKYVLLATYASIAILGDGLHSLLPEACHHDLGGRCIVVHHHESRCGDEALANGFVPDERSVTANACDADSHICEICAFLVHAVSQTLKVAAPIESQPVVAAAATESQPFYASTSLGPQAARGPPLLAG